MTSPLINSAQLLGLLGSESLRIIDVRSVVTDIEAGQNMYEANHIPGAIFLSLDTDLSEFPGPGRHPLPSSTTFSKTLGSIGVGFNHQVVIYDQLGGAIAARLWWMLENLGHRNVQVLDGGFPHWEQLDLPLDNEAPTYSPVEWEPTSALNPTVDRDELLQLLGTVTILDARAAQRHAGEVEPLDAIAGHIPTAISAHLAHNLEGGLFKSRADLRARFNGLGVDSATGVVNSCGSGVTACHNILAMRVAGLGQGTLYPGSWSDWSSSGLPVAVGPEPGVLQP